MEDHIVKLPVACMFDTHGDIQVGGQTFHSMFLRSYFTTLYNISSEEYDLMHKFIQECLKSISVKSERKFDPEVLMAEFKEIVYRQKIDVTPELAIPMYALMDCLGGLDVFHISFVHIHSMNFFLYLVQNTINENLARRIMRNLHGDFTDNVGPVSDLMFYLYIEKLTGEAQIRMRKELEGKVHAQTATPEEINNYAYMLQHGLGGNPNLAEAKLLYRNNWIEQKIPSVSASLAMYQFAHILNTEGFPEEAMDLFQKNWEENGNSESLYTYANSLSMYDPEEAVDLFQKNWEKNRNAQSLYSYAYMADQKMSIKRNLHWKNWEENGYIPSLLAYADLLGNGVGGDQDRKLARELLQKCWEEYRDINALRLYLPYLANGIAGPMNVPLAEQLRDEFIPNFTLPGEQPNMNNINNWLAGLPNMMEPGDEEPDLEDDMFL